MRKLHLLALASAIAAGVCLAVPAPPGAAAAKEPPVSFKEDVLPVFQIRCASCHSPEGEGYKASGLDLTTYKGVLAGTKYGAMVVPGDPDSSNPMRLIDWKIPAQMRMPHNKKRLSVCDRDAIRTWIRQGAKDN
jgi:mono/diheme cytochrome c family protein